MNPKINNQNDFAETEVQPAPVIDVSELFQKDPIPVDDSLKAKLLARFTKNNILIATVLLAGFLMGGGLIYAGLRSTTDQPWAGEMIEDYGDEYEDVSLPPEESEIPADVTEEVPTDDFGSEVIEEPAEFVGDEENYVEDYVEEEPLGSDPPPEEDDGIADQIVHSVSYTNSCYSPNNLTIKKDEAVIFTNDSDLDMWPASNNHPSHSLYPEFDATGNIGPGDTYSFTFTKVGVWGYHDHAKLSCTGTITVQ